MPQERTLHTVVFVLSLYKIFRVPPSCGILPVHWCHCYAHALCNWLTNTMWSAYHSRSTEETISRSQQNHYGQTKALSSSQQHHLSCIHSVLVSRLFILKSPNIGFDNFTVSITSPSMWESKKAEIGNNGQPLVSRLFILKSPNIGFDNFTVSITSPSMWESKKAEIGNNG